jgi:serine/threonine protein kinase
MDLSINNDIISKLLSSSNDHKIGQYVFKYMGKGSEGVVYGCNNRIVKIYTRFTLDSIIKEFYVVGMLQELDGINNNVVHIDNYYLSLTNPVIIMEPMKGDLLEWCQGIVLNKKMNQKDLDDAWISMIFQVTYGFMFLNKLGIVHFDTKPRNIMYMDGNNIDREYSINNIIYRIPQQSIFKIIDFGSVQILGSTLNTMDNDEIKKRLDTRSDLYDLSRITYTILLGYVKNDYGWKEVEELMKTNENYRQYKQDHKLKLEREIGHIPQKVRDNMLLKALIYYGIENDIIDKNKIIEKHGLVWPSIKVTSILDRLTDLSVKNVFKLFDVFKSS